MCTSVHTCRPLPLGLEEHRRACRANRDKLARRTCSMGPGAVQASCKGLISFCITHQSSLHRKHVQGPKRQRELQTKGAVHLLEKSQADLDHQLN